MKYESAEDLMAAAKASHDSIAARMGAERDRIEAEIRQQSEAHYGPLPAPRESDQGNQPNGDPTVAQLSAMSVDELDELEKRSPGTIERVLRSADQMS